MAQQSEWVIPRLMIIAERGYCTSAIGWKEKVHQLLEIAQPFRALTVQLRNKAYPDDWHHVQALFTNTTARPDHPLILNGMQWPDTECPRHLPENLLNTPRQASHVGASVHSLTAAQQAIDHPVQFLQYGAIFPTSKPVNPLGIPALQHFCQQSPIPVLAVGGIQNLLQVQACLDAGAYGVSIGSWILHAQNPTELIKSILEHIAHHASHQHLG